MDEENYEMNILFITGCDFNNPSYGGAIATKTRFEAFSKMADVDYIHIRKKSNFNSALSLLEKNFPPLSNKTIRYILEECEKKEYEIVILENSLYGNIAEAIKSKIPKCKIIVMFQNCEYDYIEVRLGERKSLKKTLYKPLAYDSEKKSLTFSNANVVFSLRDRERIKKIYGKEAEYIIPFSMEDKCADMQWDYKNKEGYCLLFGPPSASNIRGFRWFVKNVSPYIKIKTLIAGKGMELHKDELCSDKVEVIGFVEDLNELYAKARLVAIPLLDGCGMKIKTAEAMMFGKHIFGTDEAFSGYDSLNLEKTGGLCNSAEEFINAINGFVEKDVSNYNEYSRKIFVENYSDTATELQYIKLVDDMLSLSNVDD